MDVYEVMKDKGIVLPKAPPRGGAYASAKRFAQTLVYISGCGPAIDAPVAGKLGRDVTVEEGIAHARACMLNVLAVLEAEIGDLNRVKSAVKILCFVASADDFYQQPAVANGASGLLAEIFGEEAGLPSRSAVGMNVLPGNIPVEVEALFELKS